MKHQAIWKNETIVFTVVVLLLGIVFRFSYLNSKVYWIDEVHTSLRASGYSRTEFVEQAPEGKIVEIAELQKFQQLTPERNFIAGIRAISSSEHSPLYYVLTRLGMEFFGSSINVTRGVAAFLSLLLFPSVYWLSWELFNSQIVSLIATAFVAVSPLQILYAQEAREYSLFAVTIVFASAVFLRVFFPRDSQYRKNWHWYSLAVALGLYTQPLFLYVIIAHGIYLAAITKFKKSVLWQYAIATGLGILLFLPWILVFIFNGDGVGMWIERDLPLNFWLQRWMLNLSAAFFDWQTVYSERLFDVEKVQDFTFNYTNPIAFLIVAIAALMVYCCYFLLTNASYGSSLFLLLLIIVPATILALPDLISGGQRSTIARYLIAVPLGFQLIVAYCIGTKISSLKTHSWQRQLWRVICVFTITLSVVCSWQMIQSATWWNKYSSYYNAEVAQIINQAQSPLVISNVKRISRSTSLSHQLNKNARFLLLKESNDIPAIEDNNFTDIFLFRPYPNFLQKLQQNNAYNIEPIFAKGHLYKLTIK